MRSSLFALVAFAAVAGFACAAAPPPGRGGNVATAGSALPIPSGPVGQEPSDEDPNRFKWTRVPPGLNERYGHAELVVHATPDAVRSQLTAYGHYKDLAPTKFEKTRIIGADSKAHTTDVYLEVPILHGAGHFWAVLRFDQPKKDGAATTLEAHMVEGNMKTMHAKWTWEPKGDDTFVGIDLLLVPNFPVPAALMDEELRDAAGNAIRGVERRVSEPPAEAPAADAATPLALRFGAGAKARSALQVAAMKTTIFAALAVVLAGCSSAPPPPAQTPATPDTAAKTPDAKDRFAMLSVDDVAAHVTAKDNKLAVYDANSKERFAQGHVPGAKWVDSSAVAANDLPSDKAQPVVFYCGNEKCQASHQAANKAIDLGYSQVSVMPAGILGWEKAGKPTEK